MMTGLRTPHVFTVPGEHDSVDDAGQKYLSAFGAGTRGDGWYSFDIAGVHLIALVNTLNLKKLGHLGVEQLDFIAKDVAPLPNDTPIIVFSHIPRHPSAEPFTPVLVGDLPQRSCPPGIFQNRRQCDVLQRDDDRLPATSPGRRACAKAGHFAGR